jgi:hypothetical protein
VRKQIIVSKTRGMSRMFLLFGKSIPVLVLVPDTEKPNDGISTCRPVY